MNDQSTALISQQNISMSHQLDMNHTLTTQKLKSEQNFVPNNQTNMGSNGAKTESLDHSSSGRQQDRTMPADTTYNNQMTQGNRTQQIPQGSQMMSRQNETTYNDSVSKQDFMAGLGNDISNAQTLRRQQSVGSVQIKGLRGLGNTTNASNLIEENQNMQFPFSFFMRNNIFDRQRSNSEEMKMDLSHEEQKVSIVLKSNQNPNGFSKKLLSDESVMNQMNGEFSIITSYGNDDQSSLWSVNNPHKPTKQDHFVYTVNVRSGIDNEGQFEVFRRFKEFYLLRQVFVERCPGLYIPPIPPKINKFYNYLMIKLNNKKLKNIMETAAATTFDFRRQQSLLAEEEEINEALEECLNDIWDNYDADRNGTLEFKEAKKFLKDVMKESGMEKISTAELKKAFDDFDTDGSGAISKDEMKVLIRMLTGI